MAEFFETTVRDEADVAVAGALGYVYADGVLASLTDALGGAVSNPVTTDAQGYASFYVTYAASYSIKWHWLGRNRLTETVHAASWPSNASVTATLSTVADIPTSGFASTIVAIRVGGYAAIGDGGDAIWVADATATSALASAHPLACKADANGRYWRLLPEGGRITVEQVGAVGAMDDSVTTNQRVPIQSASNYALAMDCKLLFTKPYYSYWQQARTDTTQDVHVSTEGVGFIIDGGHAVWESTCERTTLKRRAPAGGDPATWANWPLLPTSALYWRGGGLFLKGTTSAPANFSDRAGITMRGIVIDGGISRGSSYGAFNTGTGDGWDVTDKGLWGDGDRYKGDVYIYNGGFTGFRGELTYLQGGDNNDRKFVMRQGILGDTNASALNIEGRWIDIDGLYIYKCSKWSESWGGAVGRVVNVLAYDCVNDGFMAAGQPGFGGPPALTASINYPTRYVSGTGAPLGDGRLPTLRMDVTFVKCGIVYVSQWTKGRLTLIDTPISIGNNTALLDGTYGLPCKDIELDLTMVTDTVNNVTNLSITGGQTTGKMNTDDIVIRMKCLRSDYASANAYNYPRIFHDRSLGPNIRINLDLPNGALPPATQVGLLDYMPIYDGTFFDSDMLGGNNQNVQTTPAVALTSPIIGLTGTASGTYNFTLPTTKVAKGARLRVFNNSGGSYVFLIRPSGDGLSAADHQVLVANEYLDLRYNGFHNLWEPMKPAKRYKAAAAPTAGTWALGARVENSAPVPGGNLEWVCTTAGTPGTWVREGYMLGLQGSATYDAPSIAAAGTTTTTVTVTGAALGDKVKSVTFGVSLGGLVQTAYVSAANTVTIVLYNPTAGAIDLASTTVTVEVEKA